MSFLEFRSSESGSVVSGDLPGFPPPAAEEYLEGFSAIIADENTLPILDGPFVGLSVREAISRDSGRILGPRWDCEAPFPLCVFRWRLDGNRPLGSRMFTADDDARHFIFFEQADFGAQFRKGFYRDLTSEEVRAAVQSGRVGDHLASVPVSAGNGSWIRPGQIWDAIGPLTLLQIAPRRTRTVHLSSGPGSPITLDAIGPIATNSDRNIILNLPSKFDLRCGDFRIRKNILRAGDEWIFKPESQARIVVLISGSIRLNFQKKIARGSILMLCYGWMNTLQAEELSTVLLIDEFASESNTFTGR